MDTPFGLCTAQALFLFGCLDSLRLSSKGVVLSDDNRQCYMPRLFIDWLSPDGMTESNPMVPQFGLFRLHITSRPG